MLFETPASCSKTKGSARVLRWVPKTTCAQARARAAASRSSSACAAIRPRANPYAQDGARACARKPQCWGIGIGIWRNIHMVIWYVIRTQRICIGPPLGPEESTTQIQHLDRLENCMAIIVLVLAWPKPKPQTDKPQILNPQP